MGTYVYGIRQTTVRTTAKTPDGPRAIDLGAAKYLYKPYWSGFDADKRNHRMAFESGALKLDAYWKKHQKPRYFVVEDEARAVLNGTIAECDVYENLRGLSTFSDDPCFGVPGVMPVAGKLRRCAISHGCDVTLDA